MQKKLARKQTLPSLNPTKIATSPRSWLASVKVKFGLLNQYHRECGFSGKSHSFSPKPDILVCINTGLANLPIFEISFFIG